MGEAKLSFLWSSLPVRVHLRPDVVEYPQGGTLPLYDQIIGKEALHEFGAILGFKEKTITIDIDEVLLPMSNINNLPL